MQCVYGVCMVCIYGDHVRVSGLGSWLVDRVSNRDRNRSISWVTTIQCNVMQCVWCVYGVCVYVDRVRV